MSFITEISVKILQTKNVFSASVFTPTGFVPVGFQSNATAYAFKACKDANGLVAFLLKMLDVFMY